MAKAVQKVGFLGFHQLRRTFVRPSVRLIGTSHNVMGAHDADFEAAQARVTKLSERPDNTAMLKLYALFKQASVGKCNTKKPGALDFVGKAKWSAWNDLGDISQDEAQKQYIDFVAELVAADGGAPDPVAEATPSEPSKYNNLAVTNEGSVCTIKLNRPSKKNALTREGYQEIAQALKEAAENDQVSIAVLTGAGDYYCSGNDLSNFMGIDMSEIPKMAKDGAVLLEMFVNSIIDFPKPLIAAVNGPAVGVACTTLGLCDVVYSTDKATFQTPMVALGQSPEGCSSVIFPKVMGLSRASEMLLFARKISAQQACEWGLVTEVFPEATFHKEVQDRIKQLAQLPKNSLRLSKQLMRDMDRDLLKKANKAECDLLEERWQSDECFTAIMEFFSKKSKL